MAADDRHELILSAAMRVFAEQGYHNAKITRIAEMAGIGAGSVYLHFSGKEDILEALFMRAWTTIDERLEALDRARQVDAVEKLRTFVQVLLELVGEHRELARIFLHEYRVISGGTTGAAAEIAARVRARMTAILETGRRSKAFRSSLRPELAIAFISGGIWHLAAQWADRFDAYKRDDVLAEAMELVHAGVQAAGASTPGAAVHATQSTGTARSSAKRTVK